MTASYPYVWRSNSMSKINSTLMEFFFLKQENHATGVQQTENSEYRTKENALKDANLLCSSNNYC